MVLARVPDLLMPPLYVHAAWDARRGRLRRCAEREAHVQDRSDHWSAFLYGTLGRPPRDLDRRTPYTPGRVPQLRDCGRRERKWAGGRRQKKRHAYVSHVLNLQSAAAKIGKYAMNLL